MTYSFGTVVSKEFRDKVANLCPRVFDDPLRIRFMCHVLYIQRYTDREADNLLWHEHIREKVLGVRDTSFSIIKFLTEFQDCVDFPLNVTDFNRLQGKARTFEPTLTPELESLLKAELEIPRKDKIQPVYFYDGSVYSKTKESKARKDEHVEHYKDNSDGLILNYFSQINPIAYNPYYQNIDGLIELVVSEKDLFTHRQYMSRLLQLDELQDSLVPKYFENSEYERVWAEGYSLQNLKSEYRREILKGCVEADLVSAHLSIAAYDWNIPNLKILLESNINIWKYIHDELNLDFSPVTKAGFKTGVYAIMYGGGRKKIISKMTEDGLDLIIIERFLQVPIIVDIMAAGKKERKRVTENGYIYLADGTILKPQKKTKERKALKPYQLVSWRAISIERYIIEGVFEVATKYPKDFRILSLEHDGFTFTMLDKSKEKTVWNRLAKAVTERGKELGIRISLEQK